MQHQSEDFKEIAEANPALYVSLRNQFIPAMEYTYTYDNASGRRIKNPIWWQSTVTSAGNITSLIYRAFGKPFNEEDKSLLGAPFAQFVKLNTELRHLWNIDKNNAIASRMAVGALFTYGNATIAPYSEQFYVGGANSIRAFTVRSVGPGGYHPKRENIPTWIRQEPSVLRRMWNIVSVFSRAFGELPFWMQEMCGCCAKTESF